MIEQHPSIRQLSCAKFEHPAPRLALVAEKLQCNGILLFIERGREHMQSFLYWISALLFHLKKQRQRLEALGIEDGKGAILNNQHPIIVHQPSLTLLEEADIEDVVRVWPFLIENVLHKYLSIEVLPIIHY